MSSQPRCQDSDDEPILESCHIECFVSIRKLTDEDISKYTNGQRFKSGIDSISGDHNYSVAASDCDSQASTLADDSCIDGISFRQSKDLSLYADEEIYSIEIDRGTRKRIQLYDKCVIPEKLITKYNQMKKRSGSTLPLFCLFCLKEYTNVNQVILCHYRESKHFPYRCVACEEVTLDTKNMLTHFLKVHPKLTCVQYRRTFAPAKERWIEKFVTYQLECITNQAIMIPNSILHKYCPVCNQYDFKLSERTSKNKPQHKLFTVLDKNHIHKHLKYHPFQCKLCLEKGIRFDLSMINRKGRLHLIDRHNMMDPSDNDLKEYFPSTGMIPELERYIGSYVRYVQEQFNDNRKETKVSPIKRSPSKSKQQPIASSSKSLVLSSPMSSIAGTSKQPTPLLTGSSRKGKSKSTPKSSKGMKKRLSEYSIDDMYYPEPKYSRKDSKGVRRNSKAPSTSGSSKSNEVTSVIDLDDYFGEEVEYPKPEQTSKVICFFCSNMVTNLLVAWDHYAVHLEYHPITCQLCHKNFPGAKTFQLHGVDHIEHDSLPYRWNHDEVIEAWISDFVHSFTNAQEEVAKPEFACCCLICCKKFPRSGQQLTIEGTEPRKLSYEEVRNHIYAHIRYQPFHCNICKSVDSPTYVSDLEIDGARHLTSVHQIIAPKDTELIQHFTKSRNIDALDLYLAEYFAKLRRLFNIPGGNCDTTIIPDPVCDVATLFSSLQETLGSSTLNNILDRAISVPSQQQQQQQQQIPVQAIAQGIPETAETGQSTASNLVSSSTESTDPMEVPCTSTSTTLETNEVPPA